MGVYVRLSLFDSVSISIQIHNKMIAHQVISFSLEIKMYHKYMIQSIYMEDRYKGSERERREKEREN